MPNRLSHLNIVYQNVRGLNTKTEEFSKSVSTGFFHVVALSETWIQSDFGSSEIFNSNYIVFRKDRDLKRLNVRRGGGVLLGMLSGFDPVPLDFAQLYMQDAMASIDMVGARLRVGHSFYYIIVIYAQPNTSVCVFQMLFEYLEGLDTLTNGKVVLIGDLNINYRPPDGGLTCSRLSILHDFSSFLNLTQYNHIKNDHEGLLDLVLANFVCQVGSDSLPLVPADKYHPVLNISVPLDNLVTNNFPANNANRKYNFKKANFPLLYSLLSDCNWELSGNFDDVNNFLTVFYQKLDEILQQCVPLYLGKKCKRFSYPVWYTAEIIKNIRYKYAFFKKWKSTGYDCYYNAFKSLRTSVKLDIDNAYCEYISGIESSIRDQPESFWKFINQRKNKTRIPGTMFFNGGMLNGPMDIVNAFADFFSGVFVQSNISLASDNNYHYNAPNISLGAFSESEILKALSSLKNKLTSGMDGIPAFLIKDCARVFAKPLMHLFNLSIKTLNFPDAWKIARICPVLKSGDVGVIENYRPISIISNFAKVFEKCIYNRIFAQIKPLITTKQHGFFQSRSTTTNLMCFLQYCCAGLNEKLQIDAIYTDFSKAFDRLDHGIIATKMSLLGFHPSLVQFFLSYLQDRIQCVEFNGFVSRRFVATSGAPQGSNLAPLIFSLFVNDIVSNLQCETLLFADDLKLFRVVRDPGDCHLLQHDLDTLSGWCLMNRLPLNVNKCKKVTIFIYLFIY